jgi:FKBP-type peptidyl-prolyl cis-trans isomerase
MFRTKQIKKPAFVLTMAIGSAMLIVGGCKSGPGGYKTTASKLEYKIIEDESGTPAKIGDYMKIHLKTVVHDSAIFDTHGPGMGYRWLKLVPANGQKYDLMEGLALLSKGDSAEFVIPSDSVMNAMNRPPFVKNGDMIHIYVKVLDVEDEKAYQATQEQEKKDQLAKDEKLITAYLDSAGLKGEATENGVYVVKTKDGSGPLPQDGQEVSVMYTGQSLSGKAFDSNEDTAFHHTDPLSFVLGQHRMIPGMEEGVRQLKKGADALIFIPSGQGYGPMGSPPVIEPNEVLMFHVVVKDITGKPAPATSQQK